MNTPHSASPIIVALGVPSAFGGWGIEAVRQLAQWTHPGLQQSWIDRYDPFDVGAEAQRILVCSQFPSRPLREALSARGAAVFVFSASALDAVHYQRQHQSSLLEAVRTVGASIALLEGCTPLEPALHLDASSGWSSDTMIRMMAEHIGFPAPAYLPEALLNSIGPAPDKDAPVSFTEMEESIVTLVLENGIAHLRDASVPLKSIWPHRVFFSGDRPNEEAPLVVDATGGSRVLYYGPYFHLAEGRWRAKLTLGFTKEAVGLPLKMAAYGPGLLGEARLRPHREGIFAAQFIFSVTEPEHPVEFHVRTEEGAIEGKIALGQAELVHLGRERSK